ncbi:hypothetical protein [Nonlabens sp. YIK11]|uniref:hypothetical protein n=1 Tax=Nonlabens sp. YIK11 TaxID=1453349 RepID=UPI000A51228B|nr:hypothetical protein [Nonlabens sp. YIK11]
MKTFNDEIENIGRLSNRAPIFDGIVNEHKYLSSNIKLMWILKDANSTGEDESYDLREAINTLKRDYGIRKDWENTFRNIIYVTNGILNDASWEDIPYPKDDPSTVDILQNIAFINVKKVGGGSRSKENEIYNHYQKYKAILFEQIDEFNPDVIIFGNTYRYFKEDLGLNQMNIFGSCHATVKDNRIYLSAYHPNARIKEKVYFDDIMTAYNAFRKVSQNLYSERSFKEHIMNLTTEMDVLVKKIDNMQSKLINVQKFEKAADLRALKMKVLEAKRILS